MLHVDGTEVLLNDLMLAPLCRQLRQKTRLEPCANDPKLLSHITKRRWRWKIRVRGASLHVSFLRSARGTGGQTLHLQGVQIAHELLQLLLLAARLLGHGSTCIFGHGCPRSALSQVECASASNTTKDGVGSEGRAGPVK